MHAILAIDQGTHASRALLFDPDGNVIASAHQAITLTRKNHDIVEQNANEILDSVHRVIEEVLAMTELPVDSAALATQRSTLVAWNYKTGMPLAPAISWQDRRCASELNTLRHHESRIRHITGLPLSPHYLAGKIHWLLKHNQDVMDALQNDTLCVGPLASFLCFHLLRGNHLSSITVMPRVACCLICGNWTGILNYRIYSTSRCLFYLAVIRPCMNMGS
ncbi:MAG: hypothetical protein IIB73_06180 [Proteobacteria bacterium]|nr:hypothetical protein [Pseudomonadota bacterium]